MKPPIKFCQGCQRVLPYDAEHFYRDGSRTYGLDPSCKECKKKYRAEMGFDRNRVRKAKPADIDLDEIENDEPLNDPGLEDLLGRLRGTQEEVRR